MSKWRETDENGNWISPDNVSQKKQLEKLIKVKLLKYTRPRRLWCKNGLVLEINKDGQVNATEHTNNPLATMQVISIGTNMIALWGRQTQSYLAAKENGTIYSADLEGRDCVFFERFTRSFYNMYESYHTHDSPVRRYLSLLPTGKVVMSEKVTDNSFFYWEVLSNTRSTLPSIEIDYIDI